MVEFDKLVQFFSVLSRPAVETSVDRVEVTSDPPPLPTHPHAPSTHLSVNVEFISVLIRSIWGWKSASVLFDTSFVVTDRSEYGDI